MLKRDLLILIGILKKSYGDFKKKLKPNLKDQKLIKNLNFLKLVKLKNKLFMKKKINVKVNL